MIDFDELCQAISATSDKDLDISAFRQSLASGARINVGQGRPSPWHQLSLFEDMNAGDDAAGASHDD